ncbi:Dolichyl-diphosphooligosaccharide-protein glycosyltransferase subunit dad1 [Vermiconidia calcicola]|uniref:Dolichyl-diphosphooligosaccharide-protein glycosyltransferase subunit dad1 n=1 Tax=Vermiconidia calcicola TaxID=1690605 RepID=A0ACC3N5D1_9PEZI|nr:Dolichyl-diphosphooligosaccharide-protein glycosyltransferase subunit dad1 [Vermiconidia calcicola]
MSASANGGTTEKTYFEQQRELLIGDVATSLENVLQNINKLNRSLEGVIAVGNEFSQVEGLWSQFENVMSKQPEKEDPKDTKEGAADGSNQQ